MTQPQKFSADQISYHCAVLSMKTSGVHKAQIRNITYDNKNVPSSRKLLHDCITSMHCIFLHHATSITVKGCSMLLSTHCKSQQHVTLCVNALWNAAIFYSVHNAQHCNMLLWMH